jgi:hypothetical protein
MEFAPRALQPLAAISRLPGDPQSRIKPPRDLRPFAPACAPSTRTTALVHRSMTASSPYAHHRHVPWCWHRCPFMGDICLTSRIEQNAITASPDRRLDFGCYPAFRRRMRVSGEPFR